MIGNNHLDLLFENWMFDHKLLMHSECVVHGVPPPAELVAPHTTAYLADDQPGGVVVGHVLSLLEGHASCEKSSTFKSSLSDIIFHTFYILNDNFRTISITLTYYF